jgi:prepilin-type N-terminal cleavage/methylation domain-containing protein
MLTDVTPERHAASQAGYSLIEVLVACAIAGVLMGSAVPRLPPMLASFALQNTTFQIVNDLRLARQRAVTTNGNGRLVFGSGNYRMRRESPPESGYVDDGVVQSVPTGITITSNPVNPTFNSRGLTAAPYTITIANAYSTTKTITVTAIGRVTVD